MEKKEIKLIRKSQGSKLQKKWKDGVLYFTFPELSAQEHFVHGFSSRIGGVSQGEFAEMNLSFTRGDQEERVRENYRRIAGAIGFDADKIVCSDQTHTNYVREVTESDCGKGYLRKRDYTDVDGLITNVPGIVLATFYADCVPLYFIDPVHRAIGLSHSGWRGTVSDIAGVTVKAMREKYGTDPADILAAIGPSICQDCYEVSEDVIDQFKEQYEEALWPSLFYKKENGKYQLNLWEACRRNMLHAGIQPGRIELTDLCTCCNPGILFSHRASHGRRGNLAAFLGIRE
ncbi:MAG: peptidoglycan editing factor PgeF [Lachnospiraceae bacterium]|nr:peptidoglycan editing factor PgeF [Lachnospiraceae bacterium]